MYEMTPVFITIGFYSLLALVFHMRGRKWDALDKRLTAWREAHGADCDKREELGLIFDDFNGIASRRERVLVGE